MVPEKSIESSSSSEQDNQLVSGLLYRDSLLPGPEVDSRAISPVVIDVRDGRFSRMKADTEAALRDAPQLTPLALTGTVNEQLRNMGSNRFLKDRADYPGPDPNSRWSVMEVDQYRRDRRVEKVYEYRINWKVNR